MTIIRQLLRQPLKLISGILVVSLAVSILSVCLGQAIAAGKTEENLETIFTTIALPTTKYQYIEKEFNGMVYQTFTSTLPEKILTFIEQLETEHPDLVKAAANPGLASAYLPELSPDNVTGHNYYYPYRGSAENQLPHRMEATATYACAMLEIVLEEIGEPVYFPEMGIKEDGTEVSLVTRVTVDLRGTIQSAVSLEEGYDDPTGRIIYLTLELENLESLAAMNLEAGQRYLVYGTDYLDGEWALRGQIAESLSERLGYYIDYREIDTDKIVYYSELQKQDFMKENPQLTPDRVPEARYYYDQKGEDLYKYQLKLKNAVTLTVTDKAAFGKYKKITHGNGAYPTIDYTRYLTDEGGNQVQITEEAWQARYQTPTMAALDSTAEEFLATNPLWKKRLEYMEVNHHAFPVIGVEKLGYIADFGRETARIVEGRDFTEEELQDGAKVCILSESLAAANGLQVGDTIRPQFYNYDYDNPDKRFISNGAGVVNPRAYTFGNTTEWAGSEEYTIIGLYRQDNAWGDVSENLYSFTPNTIFVPHSSVASDMDHGNHAFFQTLILQNGKVAQFRSLVEESGYEGLFVYYDRGYTTVADTLMNYREVAQKAMVIGVVVYGVILLLFLLLFPGSQGRNLNTMNALGAKRGQRFAQVFFSGVGILLPGSMIGCLAGMLLWGNAVSRLAESAGTPVSLKMEPIVLIGIALVQLALALLLTALLALPMSRNQGIRKRK